MTLSLFATGPLLVQIVQRNLLASAGLRYSGALGSVRPFLMSLAGLALI
jgi:hypothetical protein